MTSTSKKKPAGLVFVGGVAAWVSVAACGGAIPSAAPIPAPATDDPYAESETTAASVATTPSASAAPIAKVPTSVAEACALVASADADARVAGIDFLEKRRTQLIADASTFLSGLGLDAKACSATTPKPPICNDDAGAYAVSLVVHARDLADAYAREIGTLKRGMPAICTVTVAGNDLELAERQLKNARVTADLYLARKKAADDAEAARKKELDDRVAAYTEAMTACQRDMPACKAACAKDVAANECVVIATMYSVGDKHVGVSAPDYRKAMSIYTSGCGAGNKLACSGKALTLKEASECEGTDCEAMCGGGLGNACENEATAYINGYGVTKSLAKGISLLKKACGYDVASGCYRLGAAYFEGIGTPKDGLAAQKAFKKACDLGHKLGCAMYERSCLDLRNC